MRAFTIHNQMLASAVAIVAAVSATPAAAQTRMFNVAPGPASASVPQLAKQAGIQILARGDAVAAKRTNAVRGVFTVDTALRMLLRGTGLRAAPPSGSGIIIISPGQAHQAPEGRRPRRRLWPTSRSRKPRRASRTRLWSPARACSDPPSTPPIQ